MRSSAHAVEGIPASTIPRFSIARKVKNQKDDHDSQMDISTFLVIPTYLNKM